MNSKAAEPDRLLAAERAGDPAAMNDEPVGALLTLLCGDVKPEKLRVKAAISLGPVLEQADTDGLEDMDEVPITERTFHAIQETLRKTYLHADVPQEVRRHALEASVRAPQDWHFDPIRAVFNSGDVAANRYLLQCTSCAVSRRNSLRLWREPDIHYDAVCAAGN